MENSNDYIIEECRHCGNKTKLDILGKYFEYSDQERDYYWEQEWLMLKCCSCGKISLGSFYSGEDTISFSVNDGQKYNKIYTTHFPIETYTGTNVPEKVNDAFSSALKVLIVLNIEQNTYPILFFNLS